MHDSLTLAKFGVIYAWSQHRAATSAVQMNSICGTTVKQKALCGYFLEFWVRHWLPQVQLVRLRSSVREFQVVTLCLWAAKRL